MKHILFALSFVLLLAGCSKEPAEAPAPEPGSRNEITFKYRNYFDTDTRATVPAETAEKVIRDMDIFAFDQNGTYVGQLTEGVEYDEQTTDGYSTIKVRESFITANSGKTLTFYFVGNNAASTGGAQTAGIDFGNNPPTATEFAQLPTAQLPVLNGKYAPIRITDGTGGLLLTGKTDPVPMVGKRTATVNLSRRVARFDIYNPKPAEYQVTNIYITDARLRATLFAGETLAPAYDVTGSIDAFAGPAPADYTDLTATRAFYLYQTDLTTTTISMEVKYIGGGAQNGETHLFTLDASGATDKNIYANRRYTLRMNPADLTFTVGVGDIEDGEL